MLNFMAMEPRSAARASDICSYVILAGGLITIFIAARMVIVSYSSVPHWDLWDTQIAFAGKSQSQSTLSWLWRQENQHRLVIPKLFLLADLRWFHATQKSLLAFIFAIQTVHLSLLSWSMRALGGWRGRVWRTGVGLVAFCLFCPSQWENFIWGFQTCFVLPGLFTTLSLVALLLYWIHSTQSVRDSGRKYLVICIGAALAGSYSLSNGTLLLPLLAIAAIMLRLRFSAVLSIFAAAALNTAVYLHNYTRPGSIFSALRTPLTQFEYLATYFGSAWVSFSGTAIFPSQRGDIRAAEFIGTAGLLLLVQQLFRLPLHIRSGAALRIQLDFTLLFCLGTGLLTALVRSGFGVVQAFSSHYQTISLLYWCCLGLGLLQDIGSADSFARTGGLLLAQTIVFCTIGRAALIAHTPIRRARLRGFNLNVAGMALIADVPDGAQLHWAYPPDPNYVLSFIPLLRQQQLSAFSGFEFPSLGKPLQSIVDVSSSDECVGDIDSIARIPNGASYSLRITGWVWDYKRQRSPSTVVFTRDGIIIGFGAVGGWRPDIPSVNSKISSDYTGFQGYARDVHQLGSLTVYAILHSPMTACRFANGSRLFMPIPDR